jgi:hypothetical protein
VSGLTDRKVGNVAREEFRSLSRESEKNPDLSRLSSLTHLLICKANGKDAVHQRLKAVSLNG